MQISYELDYRDAARFTLYRSLENADVKRRKTVLRWMVTIMLLAIIPAFQLKHPAAISLVLVICFLWLAFCDTFMNHILLKQILKEHKEITYERIEISMEFDAVMLNISSAFYDAEVFANGQSTRILVKDAKNIGPFPTTGEVKLHIEKEFPWGRVKGEEVQVKDIPNLTLNLSMENETLKSEINTVVDEFYRSVFLALNEEDKSVIKGGTENAINKIYDVLEKKYFILKNKYNIKDIKIVEDKNQYRYENGVYSATIVVSVDYTVSKSFLGLNKEESNKLFFTKMLYNGKEWKAEDVENFSL